MLTEEEFDVDVELEPCGVLVAWRRVWQEGVGIRMMLTERVRQ